MVTEVSQLSLLGVEVLLDRYLLWVLTQCRKNEIESVGREEAQSARSSCLHDAASRSSHLNAKLDGFPDRLETIVEAHESDSDRFTRRVNWFVGLEEGMASAVQQFHARLLPRADRVNNREKRFAAASRASQLNWHKRRAHCINKSQMKCAPSKADNEIYLSRTLRCLCRAGGAWRMSRALPPSSSPVCGRRTEHWLSRSAADSAARGWSGTDVMHRRIFRN